MPVHSYPGHQKKFHGRKDTLQSLCVDGYVEAITTEAVHCEIPLVRKEGQRR